MTALADNLWLAFGIGIAFGFVLESAGLGSAVKLAGQFYLRDLTVFKVMFAAIVTALSGLVILDAAGFVRFAAIEIPPTFVLPQLVGGVIFGAGFVIGGYCPGTGCVGAASGHGDGVALVAGMLAGIFGFGEVFPLLAEFYNTTPMGAVTFPDLVRIPAVGLAAVVLLLASAGFVLAERLERRYAPPPVALPAESSSI